MNPKVRQLYKKFLWLAKDWPQGPEIYKKRVKIAFKRPTSDLSQSIEKGNYIIKEILALYSLKKYRHLKRNY